MADNLILFYILRGCRGGKIHTIEFIYRKFPLRLPWEEISNCTVLTRYCRLALCYMKKMEIAILKIRDGGNKIMINPKSYARGTDRTEQFSSRQLLSVAYWWIKD